MTRIIELFSRQRFTTTGNGTSQTYYLDDEQISQLGGADAIVIEVTIYDASSTDARLTVAVFAGNNARIRPSAAMGGTQLSTDTFDITTDQGVNNLATVTAPHKGRVEVVVTASDNSSDGLEWMDVEINASGLYY